MKTTYRNAWLGLAALAALLVYILACASFSPDDTKVLFPAFDPESGQAGVAVYDRTTRQTEMLLTAGKEGKTETDHLVRAQFMGDGRQIVAAWMNDANSDKSLQVQVMGFGVRRPVRVHNLQLEDDAQAMLLYPLAISGERLYFNTSSTNTAELNLKTGSIRQIWHPGEEQPLWVSGERGEIFYLMGDDGLKWGRLNLTSLAMEQTGSLKKEEGELVAYDLARKRFVVEREEGEQSFCRLFESGKEVTKVKTTLEEMEIGELGIGSISRDGQTLIAAYSKDTDSGKSVGIIEIPLKQGAAPRMTPLLQTESSVDQTGLMLGISHDGATAAFVSTPIVDDLKNAADCGLFLVDLKDPKRKVTRVSMPPKPKKED